MTTSTKKRSVLAVIGTQALFVPDAYAQTPASVGPPPDAKTVVAPVDAPIAAPVITKPATDATNVTLSAGGQLQTGNSSSLAGTVNGLLDMRRGNNGFGAGLVGNYAQGAPPGNSEVESTENLQGRIRYDRYLGEKEALFLIATGRHDKFQGLDFRLNIDPGFKYLFVTDPQSALWGEVGYDFQYDVATIRRASSSTPP